MIASLRRMIEHVEINGTGEEGLYRREGQVSERSDLIENVKVGPLPDLSLYDIHSVTAVIKYVSPSNGPDRQVKLTV